MCPQTCAYVAKKDDPESWHGTDPSNFWLDITRDIFGKRTYGLGILEWHCPHPPFGEENGDEDYCVFHTDTEVSTDYQREKLLEALDDAGEGPWDDRPEHRGQFIGATFGAIDLSGRTIAATDNHDIRFDHARFQAEDGDCPNFKDTTFETRGYYPLSFVEAEFSTDGDGGVLFNGATFRADGDGSVGFTGATFQADDGIVDFKEAIFRANGGIVDFMGATFRADGDGTVLFVGATFRADGDGIVGFEGATFRADDGIVGFAGATFRANGDGSVGFTGATFRANGDGSVRFRRATFRADGGTVEFMRTTLIDANFLNVDFGKTDLRGADLTGIDFREATVTGISVDGQTTCAELYEGYAADRSATIPIVTPLKRLNEECQFQDVTKGWDAAARAYHDLKMVFGDHGLIGKARDMHVRERRARSLEAKAEHGWFSRRYLWSLPSRAITGYGVQVRNLVFWMVALFLISTAVYVNAGIRDTLLTNISYSVLAFTVAPPPLPPNSGTVTRLVMMFETFFGTLWIVLLGYILGNRERF